MNDKIGDHRMNKKHTSLEQHQDFGARLYNLRNELMTLLTEVDAVTPKSSGVQRALLAAIGRIDFCRSVLDTRCAGEYGLRSVAVYYNREKATQ